MKSFENKIGKKLIHRLIFIYFSVSFSFVHLPLAQFHHSLGSLFNYVSSLFIFIFICILLYSGKSLDKQGINIFNIAFFALGLILFLQIIALLPFYENTKYVEFVQRSLSSSISHIATYASISLIICGAIYSDFDYRGLVSASKISIRILILFLFFEMISTTFSIEPFKSIFNFIAPLIHYRSEVDDFGGRIRGFSNEPSYLAVVVIFLVSILLLDKSRDISKNYFSIFLLSLLSAVSLSKNLLIGIAVLLLVHSIFYKKFLLQLLILIPLLFYYFYLTTISLDGYSWQYEEFGYDISTITRVGSWYAAWTGFISSPIIGNGIGLAGKLIPDFYPDWFFISSEANDWKDASAVYGTPVFSNTLRLLFEMGILGIIFFGFLIYSLVRLSNCRSFFAHDNFLLIIGFLLCYSMVDVLTYWPWFVALAIKRDMSYVR